MTLFESAVVLHLFCDWIMQNDRIAINKTVLTNSEAWLHGFYHLVPMLLIFDWRVALFVVATHILIDTRIPLIWWQEFYKQTSFDINETPAQQAIAIIVAIACDQVLHVLMLVLAIWLQGFVR